MDEMLRLVAELPRQLAASGSIVDAAELPLAPAARRMVVCGMGGSAAAAGLLRGISADHGFHLETVGDYRLPASVDLDTLVVFSSYSGNTEEVLSCYQQADPAVSRLVISSGGELSQRAEADGVPRLPLPPGLPPRAALGYGVGVLGSLLARLGWFEQFTEQCAEAIAVLDEGNVLYSPERPPGDNPTRTLARRLYGKLPILYAGAGLGSAAAHRGRAQLNENAKTLAHVATLPEMNHNEVVGWEMPTALHQHLLVVALRDRHDHYRIQRRFDITRDLLKERVPDWETVESVGQSQLARLMSLVQFFDYLSVYLAGEYGIDPMAVRSIDELKSRLAESS